MVRATSEWMRAAEVAYPGLTEHIEALESLTLPGCPKCGSEESARAACGIVGRSITLAAATTKIRLVSTGPPPAKFYCNACAQFFGDPDQPGDYS